MLKYLLFYCCVSLLVLTAAAQKEEQSSTPIQRIDKIIVPTGASSVERKAANVLLNYLKQAGHIHVEATEEKEKAAANAVFIGNTQAGRQFDITNIRHDGFLLATDNKKNVYIKAARGQGVLYGVYHLLEQYGRAKKLDGGKVQAGLLHIPASVIDVQQPAFGYREVYYPPAFDDEYLQWHKLHRFEDLWGLWGHSYFKIIPPSKYFKEHPDYFSFTNGKRQATQLCLSNEEVLKLTVAYFQQRFKEKPWAEYWSISPNDDLGFCECGKCSAVDAEEGAHSGSLLNFINKVAEQLPAVKFTTLAYTYTSKAPRKTKPRENVWIMLSTIDAYRGLPLQDEFSAAAFRRDLAAWRKLTGNLFVWDYTTQFTNYLAPFNNIVNYKKDLTFFLENGVKGVFSQGSGEGYSDLGELKSFVLAKLLWNPELDVDSLQRIFCRDYYKSAHPYVLDYLKATSQAIEETKVKLDIYGNPVNDYKSYLSPQKLDEYSNILDKAEAAVEGNQELTARVQRLRLSLEYTVLQQARFFGHEQHGYLQKEERGVRVKPNYPLRVNRFVAAAEKAGVKELSEGGLSPAAYQKEWDRIFATPYRRNKAAGAKLTLANAYVPEYPAKAERTLVDELPGYNDYSYNWLLFNGVDMVATIDLTNVQRVDSLTANFLHDPRHWIFSPRKVLFEVSADGKQFKKIGEVQSKMGVDEDFSLTTEKFVQVLPPGIKTRYIRITGYNLQQLPPWRSRPNKQPMIACDEVWVE